MGTAFRLPDKKRRSPTCGKTMRRWPFQAYLFLIITTMCWGGNAVAGKMAVGHISPLLLTTLRWSIAFATIIVFALPCLKRDWPVIRRNLPLLAAYGAIGFTAFNALLYTALQYTTAINVAIEQAAMPLVIFLANFVLFRIAVSAGQVIGFFMTLVGVALTVSNGDPIRLFELQLNRGDAMMVLAVLVYGGYTVALRFKPDIHWLSMMAMLAGAALLTSLPLAGYEMATGAMILPDTQGWLVALYTGLFPSLIAQVLYIRGNELIGSNRAGLFINLVPIFGTLFAVTILFEPLHLYHVVSLALVIGGISLAEWSRSGTPGQQLTSGGRKDAAR